MRKLVCTILVFASLILCLTSCGSAMSSGANSGAGNHTHSWTEATCTTPRTCASCRQTEGSVISHNFVGESCTMCGKKDPVVEQMEIGCEIYEKLYDVNVITAYMAQVVYRAWYFAIYRSDDDDFVGDYEYGIKYFASYVGLNYDAIVEAIDQELEEIGWNTTDNMVRFSIICSNSGAVGVVLRAFDNTGSNEIFANEFAEVKALLKKMDSSYENQTRYSVLKDYYNSALAYYEFVSSPTGSFAQLSTTLNGHTEKLNELKTELAFIYED